MKTISALSLLGLILDIYGVILIYRNGINPKVNYFGDEITKKMRDDYDAKFGEDEKSIARKKRNNEIETKSKFGLILIILGFILQSWQYISSILS